MKVILGLCAVAVLVASALIWQSVRMPTHYGAFSSAPKADVADLIERPADYLRKTITIEGTVRQQCTTMGCYFFFLSGKKMLRVDLQEIAMKAPRRNGHTARVEGQMVPYGDSFQFVASGVEFE